VYFASESGVHPTQKPVALGEYLIHTHSNEGDTVLDNTMGSGSFGVAAVNTGRNFTGIESDPDYFAIADRRIAEALNPTPVPEKPSKAKKSDPRVDDSMLPMFD
jgi:DNA modification methylase